MTDAAIRRYLDIVRREWWVVLQAVIVVGVVAGLVAHYNQTSSYQAQAQLYVEPAVGADGTLPLVSTADAGAAAPALSTVLASSLGRETLSPAVIAGAEKAVGAGAAGLGASITPTVNAATRTVTISTSADDPETATKVANAVAQSFVDVRWAAREKVLQSQITTTTNQLKDIQAQISSINAQEAFAVGNGSADTSSFETAKTVWLTQYQSAFANQQALQTSLASKDSGVQFLLPAEGATKSGSTSPLERALQGALVGLVIGIGLAALREALDTKVRDREWVENLTGLRTLGELPKDRNLRKRRLRVGDAPGSRYAESVRTLRAALMWSVDRGAPSSIAVTSPQSGDGKTTVATNLAAAFALSGLDTILVSADLRAPTVHRELLPINGQMALADRGLAELLVDVGVDLADPAVLGRALVPTRVEHLRWLPATVSATPSASLSTRAAEMLSSARARALVEALKSSADLVVIDTPLALLSEAASLNGFVDGVVLVVRPGSTRRASLRRTMRSWRGAPVHPLGVVLNGTRSGRKDEIARGSETSAHYLREQRREQAWRSAHMLPAGQAPAPNGQPVPSAYAAPNGYLDVNGYPETNDRGGEYPIPVLSREPVAPPVSPPAPAPTIGSPAPAEVLPLSAYPPPTAPPLPSGQPVSNGQPVANGYPAPTAAPLVSPLPAVAPQVERPPMTIDLPALEGLPPLPPLHPFPGAVPQPVANGRPATNGHAATNGHSSNGHAPASGSDEPTEAP